MSENERLDKLKWRLALLPSVEEQRAMYDALPPGDQRAMDERGVNRAGRMQDQVVYYAAGRVKDSRQGAAMSDG